MILTILPLHHKTVIPFFYPFGMNFEGTMALNTSNENRFQYNGKELEKDGGINLSDFGARWYDASIGRFTSVDPLASDYSSWSPYNYVMNNPISFLDPDGMRVETIFKDKVPGDEVEVKDGIDKTIVVNRTDFLKAKEFANIVKKDNSKLGISFDSEHEWTQKNQQDYHVFWHSVVTSEGSFFDKVIEWAFGGPDDGIIEISPGAPGAGKAGGIVMSGFKYS